jgi:hypothetical protein
MESGKSPDETSFAPGHFSRPPVMLSADVHPLRAPFPLPRAMSPPAPRTHLFLTPLPREGLFDPGSVFPAGELMHRILSLFWRDCCCPPYFNRTPAPVFELDPRQTDASPRALAVWWLTRTGIVTEMEGPTAKHLQPYQEITPRAARLWPRYDFRTLASPFDVEMMFHRSALASQGHRTRLFVQPDGRVRVLARSPWWVG